MYKDTDRLYRKRIVFHEKLVLWYRHQRIICSHYERQEFFDTIKILAVEVSFVQNGSHLTRF